MTEYSPFYWVAGGWLAIGLVGSAVLSPVELARTALLWMVGLWVLCLVDLLALGRAVAVVLKYLGTEGEKRTPLLIHAFYWGLLKLACLGIFTVVLFHGRSIPSSALLLGMGTLVVVPLVGGFWWNSRSLN